jgi:hypothetical protein
MGRPRIHESVDEMQKVIESYFQRMTDEKGLVTVSGLAYELGFESRQSMYDYKENAEFSYTIKRALLFVEMCYELRANGTNVAGPIFVLKNMGWKDKTETEFSGGVDLGKKPTWFNGIETK